MVFVHIKNYKDKWLSVGSIGLEGELSKSSPALWKRTGLCESRSQA